MPLELEIVGEVPEELDTAPLRKVFGVTAARAKELKLPGGIINLTFVDDAEIQRLNREYSGNDYPTDVLSFNYLETGEAIEGVIGEMAISIQTAGRQSAEAGISLGEEIALLCLHGVLHIGGYDHVDTAGQEQMQMLHRSLMEEAGLTYREFEWKD
jgi:probable rRNA maturation factor